MQKLHKLHKYEHIPWKHTYIHSLTDIHSIGWKKPSLAHFLWSYGGLHKSKVHSWNMVTPALCLFYYIM